MTDERTYKDGALYWVTRKSHFATEPMKHKSGQWFEIGCSYPLNPTNIYSIGPEIIPPKPEPKEGDYHWLTFEGWRNPWPGKMIGGEWWMSPWFKAPKPRTIGSRIDMPEELKERG